MTIHEELWNAFGDIMFDEPSHQYTDSKGTKYTSATKWIKQFVEESDWNAIKEKKAKKEGKTIEEITAEWDYKSNYATHLRNRMP